MKRWIGAITVALLAWSQQALSGPALSERFGLVHGDPPFLVELGSAWNRFDFNWDSIEREKGVFNFRELPERVEASLALGVNILPILDYEPAWDRDRSPADEETLAYWSRYVSRCVAQFKGKLRYWQAWNEPNISFWKPAPNAYDYAQLLKCTYLAAKEVDPEVRILGVNCSDIDLKFTEDVFRNGGLRYCDVVAYQPYRIAPEVGHFEEVAAARELMARFGGVKPIWFTEMGWGSRHFPFADANDLLAEKPSRRQAAFLVRYMTIIQAVGIEKVFWFAQAADDAGLEDRKRNQKRLSFYAYQHLIQLLDDHEAVQEVIPRGAKGLYAYLFTCPDKSVVVAWSVNGPQECVMPGLSAAVECRDMLGNRIEQAPADRVVLTGEPVYFLFDAAPETLADAASVEISPARLWIEPGRTDRVTVRNKGSLARRVTVAAPPGLRADPRRLTVPPGGEAVFRLSAAKRAACSRGMVRIASDGSTWEVEANIVPRRVWTYHGGSKGYLTPSLLRGADGVSSILVTAFDTPELLSLSLAGAHQWTYTAREPIICPVAVANINAAPGPEILAAMPRRQTVFALNPEGMVLWSARIPGECPTDGPSWRWTRPEPADLDGDGIEELVYADWNGMLTALSGNGEILWSTSISEHRCDQPVLTGNLLGGPGAEIVVGDSRGALHCVSGEGEVCWSVALAEDEPGGRAVGITGAPVAGVLEPGGPVAIFVGGAGEKLFRISPQGEVLWSVDLGGTMDLGSGIVLADLDNDGVSEIIASTRNHEVIALDATGTVRWRAETGAQIRSVPVVGDVDGDGVNEILVGAADWLLYCLEPSGRMKWTYNVGNRIDASPLLVDMTNDSVLDIVLPVRGADILALSAAR